MQRLSNLSDTYNPTPARCDNCDWRGSSDDLDQEIADLDQRVDAGGVVPAGECPSCGALAYLDRPEDRARDAAPDLLAALKSNRLLMYAWKGARANMGLPDDHGELNQTIAAMEAAIAKAEGRT